jgi:hypothetical protein
MSQAYWIDPQGNIAEVGERHITAILKEPIAFGLTKKYVTDTYKKHKEPLFSEGNAREVIMTKLIDLGWIRLRYVAREDFWTAQITDRPRPSVIPWETRIRDWARFMIDRDPSSARSAITIIDLTPAVVSAQRSIAEVAAVARVKRGRMAEFLNPASKKYGTIKRRMR